MKNRIAISAALLDMAVLPIRMAGAHCQVPCGIYGDEARFVTLDEHITTIEKSLNQINELSAAGDKNYNQLVRWVQNKEVHADALTQIVTYYFLAQRIKPDQAMYGEKLVMLHGLIVNSMKAKQTTDLANVAALRAGVEAFRAAYLGREGAAHLDEHHGAGEHAAFQTVEAGCASCTYKIAGVSGCVTAVEDRRQGHARRGNRVRRP